MGACRYGVSSSIGTSCGRLEVVSGARAVGGVERLLWSCVVGVVRRGRSQWFVVEVVQL